MTAGTAGAGGMGVSCVGGEERKPWRGFTSRCRSRRHACRHRERREGSGRRRRPATRRSFACMFSSRLRAVRAGQRLVGQPRRPDDRPVQAARAHDRFHADEVGEDVPEEELAERLDQVAHRDAFAFVERSRSAHHDEAFRAGVVHRPDDAARAVGADGGRLAPVTRPDRGDHGVLVAYRVDDRGGIHDVGDDDVETGPVMGE